MAPRRNALLTDVLTKMSVRPYRNIARRKSRQVYVGSIAVGGDAPISIQSMTNTLTTDVEATVFQVKQLEEELHVTLIAMVGKTASFSSTEK